MSDTEGQRQRSSGILSEDLLTPEQILPVQFQDLWHRSKTLTPERVLAAAVLWQAAMDLQKFRYAPRRKKQRLYREAYQWVASNDHAWPYSFVNLCDTLSVSVQCLRRELLRLDPIHQPVLEEAA
jgi:hypothetical protein